MVYSDILRSGILDKARSLDRQMYAFKYLSRADQDKWQDLTEEARLARRGELDEEKMEKLDEKLGEFLKTIRAELL